MIIKTFFRADIDECAVGISGCSQTCTNTDGNYLCNCSLGYQISSNNRTCVGKHANIHFMMP